MGRGGAGGSSCRRRAGERSRDFRLAAWIDDDFCPLSSEVARVLHAAVDAIGRAGATLSRDARPDFTFEYASRVYDQLLGAAECGGFSTTEIEEMAARVAAGTHDPGMEHSALRHRAWLSANERRLQMRKKWLQFFKDWDAVLMPVLPVPAIPHDHSRAGRAADDRRRRREAALLGSDQVDGVGRRRRTCRRPCCRSGSPATGCRSGLQIAGPYLEDRTTLAIAREVERLLGGFQPPPALAELSVGEI